ncbi:MAG: hypothetical protein ACPGU7_04735 [Gammaproteobacteria bacterium]
MNTLSGLTAILLTSITLGGAITPSDARANVLETAKITAADATAGDGFGYSAAVGAGTLAVGAKDDDEGRGAVYLHDASSLAARAKLVAADGAVNDHFGSALAIGGATVVVGAFGDDDQGVSSGSAYLFDAATGAPGAKLMADDGAAGDFFGWSVAASGDTVVVGAFGDDDAASGSGSAYLFDAVTGNQTAKLTASDAAITDYFGWSVALSGNTAAIGAVYDDDKGTDSGSVYLFDTTTGLSTLKLTADDGEAGDQFGYAVAMSGDVVAVGAYGDDDQGADSGAVYLFDAISGAQLAKYSAPVGDAAEHFGASIALNGNHLLVGAYGNADNGVDSGGAYLFDIGSGSLIDQLVASDGATGDATGYGVATDGSRAFVGSYANDPDGLVDAGALYAFGADVDVPSPAPLLLLSMSLGLIGLMRRR